MRSNYCAAKSDVQSQTKTKEGQNVYQLFSIENELRIFLRKTGLMAIKKQRLSVTQPYGMVVWWVQVVLSTKGRY